MKNQKDQLCIGRKQWGEKVAITTNSNDIEADKYTEKTIRGWKADYVKTLPH
jgi:hypothetical protein